MPAAGMGRSSRSLGLTRRTSTSETLSTFGFLHGQSAYEPEPEVPLDYVGHGFKRFSGDWDWLGSVGVLAPFLVPATVVLETAGRLRLDVGSYGHPVIGFPVGLVSTPLLR